MKKNNKNKNYRKKNNKNNKYRKINNQIFRKFNKNKKM